LTVARRDEMIAQITERDPGRRNVSGFYIRDAQTFMLRGSSECRSRP
jgi:hypothetical protein